MPNHKLTPLEQLMLRCIQESVKAPTRDDLRFAFRHSRTADEVYAALANLISNSYVVGSAEQPVRYHAVTGKEI